MSPTLSSSFNFSLFFHSTFYQFVTKASSLWFNRRFQAWFNGALMEQWRGRLKCLDLQVEKERDEVAKRGQHGDFLKKFHSFSSCLVLFFQFQTYCWFSNWLSAIRLIRVKAESSWVFSVFFIFILPFVSSFRFKLMLLSLNCIKFKLDSCY